MTGRTSCVQIGQPAPVVSGLVPGSQPSSTTKIDTRNTPEANSGTEVATMPKTEIERSSAPPSRMPARTPSSQRERHDQREGDAGQHGGGAAGGSRYVVDRRLVERRIAEIAEIAVAARIGEVELQRRVLQRIGPQAEQDAEPAPVADRQRRRSGRASDRGDRRFPAAHRGRASCAPRCRARIR